jgi:hypothetical protein
MPATRRATPRVPLSLEHHVDRERRLLDRAGITADGMGMRVLLGVADQFGEPWSEVRGCSLRRSRDLVTRRVDAADHRVARPHRRGELLVAAVMGTFLGAWFERLTRAVHEPVSIDRATEDANDIAEALLDVTIKALDDASPIDLQFGDYLGAMLTPAPRCVRTTRHIAFAPTPCCGSPLPAQISRLSAAFIRCPGTAAAAPVGPGSARLRRPQRPAFAGCAARQTQRAGVTALLKGAPR